MDTMELSQETNEHNHFQYCPHVVVHVIEEVHFDCESLSSHFTLYRYVTLSILYCFNQQTQKKHATRRTRQENTNTHARAVVILRRLQ